MRLSWIRNLLPKTTRQTTLELRHFVEKGEKVFDTCNPYPIWSEPHRKVLEGKIIEHYYFREIGFETFGKFKFKLNSRMREIMPKYIERWRTTILDYHPLDNYEMAEEFTTDSSSTNTANANSTSENVGKESDTPQTPVDTIDEYLTRYNKDNGSVNSNTESDSVGNVTHKAHRKGNIGIITNQKLVQQERDLIINIDTEIINELNDLFMGVY